MLYKFELEHMGSCFDVGGMRCGEPVTIEARATVEVFPDDGMLYVSCFEVFCDGYVGEWPSKKRVTAWNEVLPGDYPLYHDLSDRFDDCRDHARYVLDIDADKFDPVREYGTHDARAL